MKKIVFILLLGFSFAQVFAQDSLQKTRKWEVGLDFRPIIKLGFGSGLSGMMLRRHLPNNRALRLRLDIDYAYSDVKPDTSSNSSLNPENFNSYIALGYEWQKPFGKFQLLYGTELSLQFQKKQSQSYQTTTKETGSGYQQALSFGNNYFFGIKYFILPNLSVSAESMIKYTYTNSKFDSKTFRQDGSVSSVNEGNFLIHSVVFYVNHLVNLSYYF